MAEAREVLWPIGITFLILNILGVGLRFWARQTKKAFGYDDAALALSLVGFIVFVAMEFAALHYGIGAPAEEVKPYHNPISAAKYYTIAAIVYILTTGVSKVGVGLVLHRLSSGADMRAIQIVLVVAMSVMGIVALVIAIIFGLQCRPLSAAWGESVGTCIAPTIIGQSAIVLSAFDVAVSWLFALLPVFMLRKAQLRWKVKITIIVVLGLGAVSSVATIVRLKYAVQAADLTGKGGGIAGEQLLQITLEATIFSMTEIGLSIFAATLTALRPLIKRLPFLSDFSSDGRTPSKGQSGSRPIASSNHIRGPSYRLDDIPPSDGDSEENIIAPRVMNIKKSSHVEVNYQRDPNHPTTSDFYAKETQTKLGWDRQH
ncbi:hypothetical protein V2G26_004503 [Clonostachys chloroleuca]|uniref:Rhodopsin domain-containing protein n=1 Tax=Clonostachys chloroleuca TaxID=1926264 RepID=A0AA35VBJ3_9HYPO|nr:unnamed protein product [Clonostachys chloroleuca]